jgi:hypothetical protein
VIDVCRVWLEYFTRMKEAWEANEGQQIPGTVAVCKEMRTTARALGQLPIRRSSLRRCIGLS